MSNAEMDALVVGSVVQTPGGDFRVVRAITRHPPYFNGYPPRMSVTFAIRRRSWTGRAWTVYTRSDLKTMRYVPTPVRVSLRAALDRRLARDIRQRPECRHMTPEDVRGLP